MLGKGNTFSTVCTLNRCDFPTKRWDQVFPLVCVAVLWLAVKSNKGCDGTKKVAVWKSSLGSQGNSNLIYMLFSAFVPFSKVLGGQQKHAPDIPTLPFSNSDKNMCSIFYSSSRDCGGRFFSADWTVCGHSGLPGSNTDVNQDSKTERDLKQHVHNDQHQWKVKWVFGLWMVLSIA